MKGRKRRAGAGRKPGGPISGKNSNFSTRITAETRAAIETEAANARTGTGRPYTLSQMAEHLLLLGLATKRDREQTRPTRALSHLIGRLADSCGWVTPTGEVFDWKTDPFVFDAFVAALTMLLRELRPAGESRIVKYLQTSTEVHEVTREILSSPETLAKHEFWELWDDLLVVTPSSAAENERYGFDKAEAVALSRYTYALSNARRDLGLKQSRPWEEE